VSRHFTLPFFSFLLSCDHGDFLFKEVIPRAQRNAEVEDLFCLSLLLATVFTDCW
jgi:hypothetical protein